MVEVSVGRSREKKRQGVHDDKEMRWGGVDGLKEKEKGRLKLLAKCEKKREERDWK